MFFKYGLPLLAVAGFCAAYFAVVQGDRTPPPPTLAATPASPFANSVVGLGVVEPNTESINLGSPVAGVVKQVFIKVGEDVTDGAPLFSLDDRAARADLAVRQAALTVARAGVADAKYQFEVASKLVATSAGPEQDREVRRNALVRAEAQVAQAEADVKAVETELDQLTVRSPINGRILQLKLHAGEFAPQSSSASSPMVVLGNVTPLYVRAEVDEYDAPRIKAGASGVGFMRGDPTTKIPLKFVRFEPVAVPKKTLTGDTVERTDTRVLQVILAIDAAPPTVFVGQQMDVFLESGARKTELATREHD